MKVGISACLLGIKCKYNGGHNECVELKEMLKDDIVVPICPEVLGGLSVPRPCAEMVGNRVVTIHGEDVSEAFLQGAMKAVHILEQEQVDFVITQPRSPSCGIGYIYDGSFQKKLCKGNGVFVKEAMKKGITCIHIQEYLTKKHR